MTTICIDAYNIALPRGTGIATYGRNLLATTRAVGFHNHVMFGSDSRPTQDNIANEAALLDPGTPRKKLYRWQKAARAASFRLNIFDRHVYPVHRSGEVIWPQPLEADHFWVAQRLFHDANRRFKEQGNLTSVRFRTSDSSRPPDLMHWTSPLPLQARGIPNIYTIHDLIPLRLPHTTLNERQAFLEMHREAVRRADHIVVVSETTRQDVIRILKVPEDRVTNTYQAVHLPAYATRPEDVVRMELANTFNLEWKNYFLHFGAVEPKKNLGRIVEAYLASGINTPLVVVGGRGWLADDELALLNQYRRQGEFATERLRFYEYMSHPMLVSLIRGARATVFPSLYEGFGLPLLESMALSTAVLTSTGGSLPELAGSAALIVDPYDVGSIARGFQTLDADEDMRSTLEGLGLQRANEFSPHAYQQRLLNAYQKVGFSP